MKKLKVIILAFVLCFGLALRVSASEITTTEEITIETTQDVTDDIIDIEDVDSALAQLKNYVISSVMVLFSSTSLAAIAGIFLRKYFRLAKEKIEKAEQTNQISSSTANKIYAGLEKFEEETMKRVDKLFEMNKKLVDENELLSQEVKDLIVELRERDRQLAELLELELTETEVIPDGEE